jgi:DNA replication licensing factor MCM5
VWLVSVVFDLFTPWTRFDASCLLCRSDPSPDGGAKDCPLDPYVIVHDKCSFVDQQTIKLQEAPDLVPVGELPRHVLLSADR